MSLLIRISATLALCLHGFGCTAEDRADSWQPECVGRLELKLPGEADVAAQTVAGWRASQTNPNEPLRFADERTAGWSRSQGLSVSHALDQTNADDLFKLDAMTPERFKLWAKANPRFSIDLGSYQSLSVAPLSGTAWQYRYASDGNVRRYDRGMTVRVSGHLVAKRWLGIREDDLPSLDAEFHRFVLGLQSRPMASVPSAPGVCYPYLFLRDDSGQPWASNVAATYRLRDHPDVTVWLLHGAAHGQVPTGASRREAAERKADYFWNDDYRDYKSIASVLAPVDVYKPVKIAGREGVESYVEITRRDGTVDWGYLVAASANSADLTRDADIMFYVIRDASVARANGVAPFGDDKAFLKFARAIASTVRSRPASSAAR